MFSNEPRCIYRHNPLADVICQLRYPEILAIEANPPVEFQEAIRDIFPKYTANKEVSAPKVAGTPGNLVLQNQAVTTNYQFTTADGSCRVNLTSKFISLSSNRYTSWEDFAKLLDRPLVAFIKIYKPTLFERIGLRYINIFSREALGLSDLPYSDLFDPIYLGPLDSPDIPTGAVHKCSIDFEMALPGGQIAKIHAGPGRVTRNGRQDPEPKFIFDQDLYIHKDVPVQYAASTLDTLHSKAYPIFRGAITETMHQAMEPQFD